MALSLATSPAIGRAGPWRPLPAPTAAGTTADDPTLRDIERRRLALQWGTLGSLTGYAAVNIGAGTGLALTRPQGQASRYFHEMNIWWNVVNLTIGVVGLARMPGDVRTPKDERALRDAIRKARRGFLINTHLDLVYVAAGISSWGAGNLEQIPRLEGYGQSFVLQGAVLLGLDVALYLAHGANLRRLDRSKGHDFELMPFYGVARDGRPDRPGPRQGTTPVFGLQLRL